MLNSDSLRKVHTQEPVCAGELWAKLDPHICTKKMLSYAYISNVNKLRKSGTKKAR
jgi:hypothetical protein